MRIVRVVADGFGCLDGEQLDLPPGFVVVYGPNESGKSTWVEAIATLICGLPKGRRKAVTELVERYRPWSGRKWRLSGIVELDDGRRLEVMQDLDKRSGRVNDATTGRDLSPECIPPQGGMPDLARFCGIDESFFRYLVVVRQGRILEIARWEKKDPVTGSLRKFVEQSAASGGSGSVAPALQRLREQRQQLGDPNRQQPGSSKPIHVAARAVEQAAKTLEVAQRGHDEYIESLQRVRNLEEELANVDRQVRAAEAALVRLESEDLRRRVEEAKNLAKTLASKAATSEALSIVSDLVAVQQQLAAAIEAESRAAAALDPESVEDPERALAEIGPLPEPATLPDVDSDQLARLEDLRSFYLAAKERFLARAAEEPRDTATPQLGRARPEDLYAIVRALTETPPPIDESLAAAIEHKELELSRVSARRKLGYALVGVGALVLLVSAAYLLRRPLVAMSGGAVAACLIALALWLLAKTRGLSDELYRLRAQYGYQQEQARRHRHAVEEALRRAEQLGLPTNTDALLELERRSRLREIEQQAASRKFSEAKRAAEEVERWAKELLEALADASKGWQVNLPEPNRLEALVPGNGMPDGYQRLEGACEEFLAAARQGEEARKKRLMKSRLDELIACRSALREAYDKASKLLSGLGIATTDAEKDPKSLIGLLHEAHQRTSQSAAEADKALTRLAELKGSEGIDVLERRCREAEQRESELWQGLDNATQGHAQALLSEAKQSMDPSGNVRRTLEELRNCRIELEKQFASEKAVFEQTYFGSDSKFVSVAEAEEMLEAAESERRRLLRQYEVLEIAETFLEKASTSLVGLVGPRLNSVASALAQEATAKRYSKAYVDFRDDPRLRVEPPGPAADAQGPVDAERTSYGTAEQLYLVFRLVMADAACKGESLPVVMDEVTVHADSQRTALVLDMLAKCVSPGSDLENFSQLILFTQEREALDWARANLPEENVIELSAPA